jgi:predicted TIM-barrel fold metal-dependent hydrolase
MSSKASPLSAPARAAMPAGACDCHTHIFGAATRYPFDAQRHYTPGPATIDEMTRLHRELGIARVVIVQPSPYGTDNRCTLDAAVALNAGGADVARAVVVIDDAATTTELRQMHAAGARGVRVNMETSHFNDAGAAKSVLADVADRVSALGWHVQIYTNLAMVASLADTIAKLPVPVVLDHFAGIRAAAGMDQPGMAALLDLLAGGNVYIKMSAPHRISTLPGCPDVEPIIRALTAHRADRLVWGTDWPHPGAWPGVARNRDTIERFHPIDDAAALARLAAWTDAQTLDRILVQNPARLYGW